MILIARESSRSQNGALFDQMYALRARQFHDRRGWSVNVRDGKEIDIYDRLDPVYVCALAADGRLVGSLRLLPTLGPHMAADVFLATMGERGALRDSRLIECSRFCVDTSWAKRQASGLNRVTKQLLTGLFIYSESQQYQGVVAVHDLLMERILKRAGCISQRLGPVVQYDGLKTVCSLFEVSSRVIDAVSKGLDDNSISYALSA